MLYTFYAARHGATANGRGCNFSSPLFLCTASGAVFATKSRLRHFDRFWHLSADFNMCWVVFSWSRDVFVSCFVLFPRRVVFLVLFLTRANAYFGLSFFCELPRWHGNPLFLCPTSHRQGVMVSCLAQRSAKFLAYFFDVMFSLWGSLCVCAHSAFPLFVLSAPKKKEKCFTFAEPWCRSVRKSRWWRRRVSLCKSGIRL